MRRYLLILAAIALAGGTIAGLASVTPPPKSPPVATDPAEQGGPPPHPLMIEALRNREYPGGQIEVIQDIGLINGLRNYVIGYPSDGLKLRALMTVPNTPMPSGGYPVLVLNHGYVPADQYRTISQDYRDWITLYARNGFLVLKPDYRGHDQSEGDAASGNFGPEYTYDVLNLVNSLSTLPEANQNRVGMLGHSMGGSVTLRAIAVSDKIHAAIFAAGVVGSAEDMVYNWRRPANAATPAPPPHILSVRQRLIEQFGTPESNPDFWHRVYAGNYAHQMTAAIQIHHGTADTSVPYSFSQTLHERLTVAGKLHEYYLYEGGDHNFTGAARPLIFQRTLIFLKAALERP